MKEEVPNKLPNQTIKKYEEDGNRIRVDFLKANRSICKIHQKQNKH